MQNIACARRAVLRLFAACVAIGSAAGPALAQPPGRSRARLPHHAVIAPLRMVVIDPGHGGIDPGAISPSGVYEKDIVLATARELARRLLATRRFRVALTRDGDEFVALRERVAFARARGADLYLSVHADALPNPALRGLSVYTLSAQASDREAEALALNENQDVVDGIRLSRQPRDVGNVLVDLARRHTDNLSIELARQVVAQLGHEVTLLEHPQRSADFAVLTALDIPSVLVELGCLSNPHEERLLQQEVYRQRLARGLARAIEAYFIADAQG